MHVETLHFSPYMHNSPLGQLASNTWTESVSLSFYNSFITRRYIVDEIDVATARFTGSKVMKKVRNTKIQNP